MRRGVSCKYPIQSRYTSDVTTDDSSSRRLESESASSRLPREISPSFQAAPLQPLQIYNSQLTVPSARVRGTSTLSDASLPPRPTSQCSFPMGHLALLHHWTWSTSLSICRESGSSDMWQRVFPEIGFEHPFVTHAILSLAALHLAHTHKTMGDANVVRAAERHNEALLGFRQSVANITEGNSEALFVWSLLNMIYVFGIAVCDRTVAEDKDLVLGFEWIPMIRGIHAVLVPTHNYLRFGRMQKMMSVGNWDDLKPGSIESGRVDGYLCRTRETWENSNQAETYDEALEVLRKCWIFIQQFEGMGATALAEWGYNRSWSGPLMFIHFAPQAFFTLLHQRQPPALVLFTYFGALLHGINHYWFMQGWGRKVVEVASDLLGSYWRPWIAWPLKVVGPD